MTKLVLVRHAETIWHEENRYAGSSDIGLTTHGLEQAQALARWAARANLVAVYSSDLARAVRTARLAAAASGHSLITDPALREVDFGRGEGLTRAEMAKEFPEDLARFLQRPATVPLPGGESGHTALGRALPALRAISDRHDGTVLIVMHSTLVRLALCALLGLDPDRYRRILPAVANCALTTVSLRDDGTQLLGYNVPVI
ncbi:MAG: histidine phosphatase family protein [Microbacteriaceae bacterium]